MSNSNENRGDYGIIDLFAGPGGWDEALASLGRHDVLGVEYDEPCCRTREAAGHATLHANVAEVDPLNYAGIEGLIASPPCQAWSMAGARGGELDKVLVYHVIEQLVKGRDVRAEARADAADERSLLVVEPLRWALALRPRWVAFEQVEPVAELWAYMADALRAVGYSAWSGVLSAERYGVPQTRRRAFLIASLDQVVQPPLPTHQAYRKGEAAEHTFTLEGELLPWVSMAEALGWGFDEQPAPTVSGGGGRDNGIGVFAGQAQRNRLRATMLDTHRDQRDDGSTQTRPTTDPAPALTGKAGGQWKWLHDRSNTNRNGTPYRPTTDPAPTLTGATASLEWRQEQPEWSRRRPSPTLLGDSRVSPSARTDRDPDYKPGDTPPSHMNSAVRVTLAEALTLQSFRPDYPVQGNQGQQFQQVGNAVPPLLARAVLTSVLPPVSQEVIPHAV